MALETGTVIPLIRPNPPKLSLLADALMEIERSGIFSNYGPVNSRLEARIVSDLFQGRGECVTVANATLGLMLAVKQAVGWRPRGRYALMPSFTFAAAAHAALWCGLTPLFCDIDPTTWLPDAHSEHELLARYGDEIAVILPNATFGNCLDLPRYDRLAAAHGIPLVIDAASSLGSLDMRGEAFGVGSAHPLVFSMHATKTFATAEAGLIYCTGGELIAALRAMGNFGFGAPRTVTMPGLNSKLSEVAALLALMKLEDLQPVAEHRHRLSGLYRTLLPEFAFQRMIGRRTAHQFMPVLVPAWRAGHVADIVAELGRLGIGAGRYFVPHLAEQPFFRRNCVAGDLSATQAISARIIALPMSDFLSAGDVSHVCDVFRQLCRKPAPPRMRVAPVAQVAKNGHAAAGGS